MKKEMILKDCNIVICEVNIPDNPIMVLPQIQFNRRLFSFEDFDLEQEDSDYISDFRDKYLVLNIDTPFNYLTWKIDKSELDKHHLVKIRKFDSLESFNKLTVW